MSESRSGVINVILAFSFVFCAMFFAIGIFINQTSSQSKDTYTVPITGEIINIDSKESRSEDMDGHTTYTTLYNNTYKYVIDGKEYAVQDTVWDNSRERVGDKVTLYCNELDPSDAISENQLNSMSMIGTVFMFTSAMVFAIFAFIGFSIKYKKSRRYYSIT